MEAKSPAVIAGQPLNAAHNTHKNTTRKKRNTAIAKHTNPSYTSQYAGDATNPHKGNKNASGAPTVGKPSTKKEPDADDAKDATKTPRS